MKTGTIVAVFAVLFAAAPSAQAAVNVGDSPKLEFKAIDGTAVSMEKLKGKRRGAGRAWQWPARWSRSTTSSGPRGSR
jgi:hypothetical protein